MKYRLIRQWLGKVVVEFKKSLDRYVPDEEFLIESNEELEDQIDCLEWYPIGHDVIIDGVQYSKWLFHYELEPIADDCWIMQTWIVVQMVVFKVAEKLINVFKKLFGGLDNIKHLLDYDVVDDRYNEILRERSNFPEWFLLGEIKG